MSRVEQILHAGDVGSLEVLARLGDIAEVTAVRGNVDRDGPVAALPEQVRMRLGGIDLLMQHVGGRPALWLPRLGKPLPHVAVCGHSHIPLVEQVGGVLFVNPGAAGTVARFNRPQTVAILSLGASSPVAEIIVL